ncbi:hypothetical protein MKX01_034082 [Papaver californicum]|nr:hypothetical protein MKX01_034082 [Papaver californicum]
MRVKGLSLPLNQDDSEKLDGIYMFHLDFSILLGKIEQCPNSLEVAISIWDAGGNWKFNIGWSYLLSILKELNNIGKGDDHLLLLKRILMAMVFPEVKNDNRNPHKMLIDRSLLLTESLEHIALFKDEVATGHGVLREWFILVCQALFSPEYSLFVECPEDCCRFFPNPAQVKSQRLKFFAFCGRLIALALMHGVKLGIAFDRVFFLQLAEEKIFLEDIQCAEPIMYKSCKNILEMDADHVDSDVMGLTFENLCPGGINIVVNSKNREQYVHILIQHIFVKSTSAKVAHFKRGFGDILCKRRLAKNISLLSAKNM